jgi:hypothetical protein
MLPIISPVAEIHCLLKVANGKTIAGCEKVKGIYSNMSGIVTAKYKCNPPKFPTQRSFQNFAAFYLKFLTSLAPQQLAAITLLFRKHPVVVG